MSSNLPTAAQPCAYPEYAIGIRSYGVKLAQDNFALPRCFRDAIHGAKLGMWSWTLDGKKITHWERITP